MQINIGVLIIGGIFAVAGAAMLFNIFKRKRNNTETVTAIVSGYNTRVHHSTKGGRSIVYYPIFKYNVSGEWYEVEGYMGRNVQKYQVGDRVDILYDPNDPKNFSIPGEKSGYLMAVVFLIMGIGVIVLSMFAQ